MYASQVPPGMTASTDISLSWIRLTVRSTSRASVITSHNPKWLPLHLQCSTLPNNMKYIVPNGVNKRPAWEITNLITCLLLLISMLWHRQAIFESKGEKLSSSVECRVRTGSLKTPIRQQTECLLTNRLSYRGSSLKRELNSPSLWWVSIRTTWRHCRLVFAPGSGDIHVCCC